ncbi:hypothetical protein BJ912DRAFT_845046 [Pholiota molesta]|nr:hypothetical protein BJ912DRAFT_845046 [Pholiota molesta]
MLKNRLQCTSSSPSTAPCSPPTVPQTAPSMSPAHSYTLIPADDDDDSDICPVCDGECTCHKAVLPPPPPPAVPGVPLSMAELSLRYAAASSAPNSPSSGQSYPPSTPNSTPAPAPAPKPAPKPSLKIKLTVPPGMLTKRKLPPSSSATPTSSTPHIRAYKTAVETTSAFVAAGYGSPEPSTSYAANKKRGRPPKGAASARPHSAAHTLAPTAHISKLLHNKSTHVGKHPKASSSVAKVRQSLKARAAVVKKAANKRRRVVSSDDDESSLSDVDMDPPRRGPYADDDAESGSFPTFVSASALSSMSSDTSDSSSSLSEFDSDSSIEAEEENFILADVQDKARLKRELLGGDDPSLHKKRTGHNSDWVIRPRKKSVGPSDVEMDVESDGTEEDDEEEEGDGEDDEDADATEEDTTMTLADPLTLGLGLPQDEYEESESTDDHRRYTGHATGWSDDDDESSFDADLFFANLSDSDDTSSDSDRSPAPDGDQSDLSLSGVSESTEGARGHVRRATLESLPFEVTESWDGQLVFTNGIHDSQGLVELEFEADARGFGAADCATPAPSTDAAGLTGGVGPESDVDMSEGGYEEESGGEGSGDTTDEELVGPDALPNARAMRLFSLPLSVSAIDPLSTVSSPAVSPGCMRGAGARRRRMWGGEGVRAADILEGRVLFWDSDEQEHDRDDMELRRRRRRRERTPSGPRQGVFVPTGETRQAVIGEDRKGAAVPSPHPRFSRRGRKSAGRFSTVCVEHLLRRHLFESVSASQSSSLSNSLNLAGKHMGMGMNMNMHDGAAAEETIQLDDVLDASFLADAEPVSSSGAALDAHATPADATAAAKNLSRWDLISVGAFRQTREASWDGRHTPAASADFGSAMKPAPMSAMLWQNGHAQTAGQGLKSGVVKGSKHAKRRQIMMGGGSLISPASFAKQQHQQQQQDQQQKSRRELRRERKLSKKNLKVHGGPPQHHTHGHGHAQQFHTHHHHPNSKMRGAGAAQRSNFFGGTVPPLNL